MGSVSLRASADFTSGPLESNPEAMALSRGILLKTGMHWGAGDVGAFKGPLELWGVGGGTLTLYCNPFSTGISSPDTQS